MTVTTLDLLNQAKTCLEMAVGQAGCAEVVIGVDQEDALRRLYLAAQIGDLADEIARRANYACAQNERREGWS